ncbi:MAG: zinc-ribbon domain-containing protein [Acetobacteraceae bacterium]|nr:zinc-ribbon domain-containing protein [Acetobacteraceae bacterium]
MRLVCPDCAAAYEVPPSKLGGRRRLRCARCGREWVAPGEPAGATEAPGASFEDAPEAAEPRAAPPGTRAAVAPRPAPRGGLALRLCWAASLLVLAIAAWESVAWRSAVMRAWPPSQRLYVALGLAHAGPSPRPPPARGGGEEHAPPVAGGVAHGGGR